MTALPTLSPADSPGRLPPRIFLCLLTLTAAIWSGAARAEELLQISFTDRPPGSAKTYSSDNRAAVPELRVVAGKSVTLRRQQGHQYQARASGWYWNQVEQVPARVDAVTVTPRLEGDRVSLDVAIQRQRDDQSGYYNTTVAGGLGQWLRLLGPSAPARPGARVYGAGSTSSSPQFQGTGLYVKVERVPPGD